jgi:microcystin-dependent protein
MGPQGPTGPQGPAGSGGTSSHITAKFPLSIDGSGYIQCGVATSADHGTVRFATAAEVTAGQATNVAVTPQQLGSVAHGTVPTGAIQWFAGTTAPNGWLVCDGSTKQKSDYPYLAAVLGSLYGAATSTTFVLPDLRGEWIRGADLGRGSPAGAVGSHAAGNFASHHHTTTVTVDAAVETKQSVVTNLGGHHGHNVWLDGGGHHKHSTWGDGSGHHGHKVNDPGHDHGVRDPGHTHSLTVNHSQDGGGDKAFGESGNAGKVETFLAATGIGINAAPTYIWLDGDGLHQHTMHCDLGEAHTHGVYMDPGGAHQHMVDVTVPAHSHTTSVSSGSTGGIENAVRSLHLLPIIRT